MYYQIYIQDNSSCNWQPNTMFIYDTFTAQAPSDLILATVSRLPKGILRLTATAPIPPPPPPPSPLTDASLKEIIATQPPDDLWAIHTFYSPDEGQSLATAILQGCATAVSNGSYKDQLGTSGFILRGLNCTLSIAGTNIVPGNPNEQSSYHSELAGIKGSLAVVSSI